MIRPERFQKNSGKKTENKKRDFSEKLSEKIPQWKQSTELPPRELLHYND